MTTNDAASDAASDSMVAHPPGGLMRFFFRLPIILYNLHLGWLLGDRFVMIDHVGRKSGKPYQTVVEVVNHNRSDDSYVVASGWGYKASWYQNLMAHPETTIHSGGRTLNVRAEALTPQESAQILLDYRQKHKLAARELSRFMGKDIFQATPAELEEMIQKSLPMVVFRRQKA